MIQDLSDKEKVFTKNDLSLVRIRHIALKLNHFHFVQGPNYGVHLHTCFISPDFTD